MPVPLVDPLDFNQNEAQNMRFHNLAAPPGSPVEGQPYYDTTGGDKTVYFWDGTAWVSMKSGAPSGAAGGDLSGTYPNPQIATGVIVDADINGSANIALSKLAVNPLARANHTGTQTASTISDFDTQVRTSRLDQMAAPTADVNLNTRKITSLADPTAGTDAANKQYVDAAAAGIDWKASVRAATTAAGTLASSFENGDVIDGVTLVTGNRILIKDQAAGAENGIYTVNASGAPTRATDADVSAEVTAGMAAFVEEGTVNLDQAWVLITNTPVTLGTTALVFTQFTGLGQVTAGGGIGKAGNTLSVAAGTGLTQDADGLSINPAVVMQRFAVDVGDGTSTSIVVTHSLGTRDVQVSLYRNSGSREEAIVEVQHTSTTTVTLVFAVAPTSAQWRCVVIG